MIKYVLSFLLFFTSVNLLALELRGHSIAQAHAQTPLLKESPHTLGIWAFENINRLNLFHTLASLQMELGFEINQVYQKVDDPLLQRDFEKEDIPYRFRNSSPRLIKSNSSQQSYYALKQIDRLFVSYSGKNTDITLGRQQIAFGPAKLINPTDIFTPFSLASIDTQERNGVDAIRIRHSPNSLGTNSEFDFGAVFGDRLRNENNAFYLRPIFSIYENEIEIKPIVAWYREALAFGLDLLTSYKGANFYIESMSSFPNDSRHFHRSTLGSEYQWSSKFSTIIELHYSSGGAKKADQYILQKLNFPQEKGGVFLLSQQYINLMLAYQLYPLHLISLTSYHNILDTSHLLAPAWQWSLSDNTSINTGAFIGIGKKTNSTLLLESEFGSYGIQLFTKFIYYF
jgi:hypothetical protein